MSTGTFYEDPPARPFNLPAGGTLNEQLGWPAGYVIVDNWTNQYLLLTDIGRFVAPGEHGGVYPLPAVWRANVSFAAPSGITQPTSPTGTANLVFLSAGLNVSPSPAIPRVIDPNAGVVTIVDNGIGTGTVGNPFLVPDTSPFPLGCFVAVITGAGVAQAPRIVIGINPGVSLVFHAATLIDFPPGSIVNRVTLTDIAGPLPFGSLSSDPIDRVGRLLGIVASITAAVDTSDRAARLVGHASLDTGGTLIGQKTMANSVPGAIASDQAAFPVNAQPVDGVKATYRGAFAVTMPVNPSYVVELGGSATKTIRVTRVTVLITAAAAAQRRVSISKNSAASTGGTKAAITKVPLDANDAASAADVVLNAYSVNPTAITVIGQVANSVVMCGPATSALTEKVWEFGNRAGARAIVLRGIAQQIAINCNGVGVAGDIMQGEIEWTEE